MIELGSFSKYLRFERNYSDHTIKSYENDLQQFSQYLITHLSLDNVLIATHLHVRSWLVHLMKSQYTAKSINRKLSCLKSFYKFQQKLGTISSNPASGISGPKLAKRLPQVLRVKEIESMMGMIGEGDTFQDQRDFLLVNILYQTGLRREELINLKESDVNMSRRQLKVLGKGNKERLVPISQSLIDMIVRFMELKAEHFNKKTEYLLVTNKGNMLYPKFVYNTVHAWISKVSTINKKSPHILRHSFATHLADNGAELNAIKELLGHSSLAATQIYMHNSIQRLKDVYGKAHPRALKKR